MTRKLLVGIDIGTSGTKTLLMDLSGAVIASKTVEYPLMTPKHGWAEQDPDDWWRAVRETLSAVTAHISKDELLCVGLSGQMHGMVALDRADAVVRPAILWCDGRTEKQCADITAAAGGLPGLLSLTNNQMLPGYTGGKILWMRENEPENFGKTAVVLNPKDYIRFLLTGEKATEVSDASGTGLFDVENRRFSEALLGKIGLSRSLFPSCVESADIAGHVTRAAAEATGLPEGLPVIGGGGDAVIQTTGMGLVSQGVLGVIIGTSGVVAMGLDGFKRGDGSLQVFCNNAPGLWHAMGVTLCAGGSYRWFRDNACGAQGPDAYAILNAEAESSSPGSGGLVFLPYLTGERCPHSDPTARGAFVGLTLSTSKGDITRAVMEGVTFSLRQVAELIYGMDKAIVPEKLILSGGGARSSLWRQMAADIFSLPVVTLSGSGEGGAYGAALVAGVGCGAYKNLREAVGVLKLETETLPVAANRAAYQSAYGVYCGLYSALKPAYASLSEAF